MINWLLYYAKIMYNQQLRSAGVAHNYGFSCSEEG